MTALAANTTPDEVRWKYKQFTLTSGSIAYQGGAICYNPATQKCVPAPATAGEGLIFLGFAVEKVDASLADAVVNVDLIDEIVLHWLPNATAGDAVLVSDFFKDCYLLDDQTVTITPTGHAVFGRIWGVDATKGVLVQKAARTIGVAAQPVLAAFAANNVAPAAIVNGGVYDIPATAAASVVTLPAATPDGVSAMFTADGTKNAHTVQYQDATGTVNLTTALTASKRHLVVVVKRGGKWFANAYVSP